MRKVSSGSRWQAYEMAAYGQIDLLAARRKQIFDGLPPALGELAEPAHHLSLPSLRRRHHAEPFSGATATAVFGTMKGHESGAASIGLYRVR
jgi:hypothetical protein